MARGFPAFARRTPSFYVRGLGIRGIDRQQPPGDAGDT
jgi:hypothetical protein